MTHPPRDDTAVAVGADDALDGDPALENPPSTPVDPESLALDDPDQVANLVAEIKQRLAEVEAREVDLERREGELAERFQHLHDDPPPDLHLPQHEGASADAADDAHGHARADIAAETAELRRRRSALARRIQSAREAIVRQRTAVATGQEEADAAVADLAEQREALERTAAELAAQQAALRARAGELDERQAQVEARAAEIEQQRADLVQVSQKPDPESIELNERRAAVDKLYIQAGEIEERARARFEEAGQIKQQLVEKAGELKEYRRRLEAAQREILTEQARLKADRDTHALLEAELSRRRGAFETETLALGRRADQFAQRERELDRSRTEQQAEIEQQRTSVRHEAQRISEQINERAAAELSRHRETLQAREAALDERQAHIEARAAEIERQRTEMNEALQRFESTELAERRAAVDKLYLQAGEIEQRARARFEEAGQVKQQLSAKAGELKEYRRRLEAAQREILTERARLKTDRETQALLEAELTRRREAFELEALELSRRVDQIAEREGELDRSRTQQQAELDQQRTTLRNDTRRISEQIKDRVAQIEQRRAKLRHHAAELARQRDDLIEKARRQQTRSSELERGAADLDTRRRQLDNRAGEIERGQADLRSQSELLEARIHKVEQRESELDQLEAACRQRETAAEERRLAAEGLLSQAVEQEQRARARFEEAGQLQAQLQSKEAELASTSLSAEIGREEVETERARLLVERDTLNFLHAEAQRIIKESRPATAAHTDEPAVRAQRLRPRFWWLRAATLAGATGAAAWYGISQFEKPAYQSSVTLAIQTQRVAAEEAIAEHLREWMSTGGDAARPADPQLADAWNAAYTAGQIDMRPSRDSGLALSVRSSDAEEAGRLVTAAATAFERHVAAIPPERFFSPRMFEWKQRRAGLEAELADAGEQVRGVEARLAKVEGFDAWDRARTKVEQTQAEFDRVSRRLGEQRGQLTALRGQESARAEVPAEELDRAMAGDALYQEDLKEMAAIAREHRMALALAMMMTVDPLKDVRTKFAALRTTIAEQRDLQPSEGVAAVLEECAARLDAFDRRLAEAAMAWDEARKDVERRDPTEHVPELVKLQGEAAASGRDLLSEVKALTEWMTSRVNGISSAGAAGTREMVIASLLRGTLSGVTERSEVLAQALAESDLATNFRLETLDRQLRGLRTRSSDRRETIRRDLEQAALQTAQRSYDDQVRDLDEEVRTVERRRDELTAAMGANVSELRGLEERMQELRGLHAELRARQDAQARIAERIAEMEKAKPDIPPDLITHGAVETVQTAGVDRRRHSWIAAGATAGITLLVCVLMIAGRTSPLVSRRERAG